MKWDNVTKYHWLIDQMINLMYCYPHLKNKSWEKLIERWWCQWRGSSLKADDLLRLEACMGPPRQVRAQFSNSMISVDRNLWQAWPVYRSAGVLPVPEDEVDAVPGPGPGGDVTRELGLAALHRGHQVGRGGEAGGLREGAGDWKCSSLTSTRLLRHSQDELKVAQRSADTNWIKF